MACPTAYADGDDGFFRLEPPPGATTEEFWEAITQPGWYAPPETLVHLERLRQDRERVKPPEGME